MAEDDIYGSKARYEKFKANLSSFLSFSNNNRRRRYICKNPTNINYFKGLFTYFEARDLSYIRRLRVLQSMKFICSNTSKDLKECTRDDINEVMAQMHSAYNRPRSKETFIKDIKYIWKTQFPEKDEKGHGTEMAGLTLYVDLVDLLAGNEAMQVSHKLESVKILPPFGENDPKLYGAITKEAVARTEVTAPHRKRVISLAVTTPNNRDRGKQSSWSAAIDQLCAGAEGGLRRLVVISAGNTAPQDRHLYPDSNETDTIHDPAQGWNALCVGAFTEKVYIDQKNYPGWAPVATSGDLSAIKLYFYGMAKTMAD